MSANTKGPWFADDGGRVWRRDPRELYENGGGVAGDHPIATVWRGKPSWENGYPVEANARLVAAAPELLNAATEALEAINDGDAQTAERLLRAAIAKATGGAR